MFGLGIVMSCSCRYYYHHNSMWLTLELSMQCYHEVNNSNIINNQNTLGNHVELQIHMLLV